MGKRNKSRAKEDSLEGSNTIVAQAVLHPKAVPRFEMLKKSNSKKHHDIFLAIKRNVDFIKRELDKSGVLHGKGIRKSLIPKEYKKEGITTLFKIDLPEGWRLVYTLKRDSEKIRLVIVRAILKHKEYERLFGFT